MGLAGVAAAGSLPEVDSHRKILPTAAPLAGAAGPHTGFGFALASLGSLSDDESTTVAVGTHFKEVAGKEGAGTLWIVDVTSTGDVVRAHEVGSERDGPAFSTSPHDYFGFSIANIGDLDGDGIPDIAVGAPRDDDGGADTGAVYILFLDAAGQVRAQRKISPRPAWARRFPWSWLLPRRSQGGLLADVADVENLGIAVAGLGDVDGDGIPDIAVGARAGGEDDALRGAVWILFLRRDGTVRSYRRIGGDDPTFQGEVAPEVELGFGLAAIGDLDGDGISELAVGARRDSEHCRSCGAVWVLFLDADGSPRHAQKITQGRAGFSGRLNPSGEFGAAIAALGDADGDGIPDIAVGARGDDLAGFNTGAIWLLALNPDGSVKTQRRIGAGEGGFTGDLALHDFFGAGLTRIAGPDADGSITLAAGAEGDDEGVDNGGAIWLLSLRPPP